MDEREEMINENIIPPEDAPMEQIAEDQPRQPEQKKPNRQQVLFKDAKEIMVILITFMLIYVLFFRVVVVVGSSMENTLIDGDRLILISSTLYRNPKQGDVIVASKDSFKDGECIVKRVIATEGQTVDIDFTTGTVYVDGVALDEPYISSPTTDNGGMKFPLTVSEGCVFVMGDNRDDSLDSRSTQIGLIDEREILGKAIFLIFPGTDDGRVPFSVDRIGVIG